VRAGIGVVVVLALALAALAVRTFRRYRFEVQSPVGPAAPAVTRPALPAYPVTAAADAVRSCYGPGDPGAVVLDTVATAPGVAVVTVAAPRDRATLAYVEARQAGPRVAACLGRVVSGTDGTWSGYVRRIDPEIGIVDRAVADPVGRALAYAKRRMAALAVERAAREVASRSASAGEPDVHSAPRR
jgi:hypothetical protein